MSGENSVAGRLATIQERMASACHRAGRDPKSVRLVAVTKTQPLSAVREAYEAGQRDFGENYAQELRDKAKDFPEARWHFIGHLQTNKVKYVVGTAALVHSVDSEKILEALSERAEREKLVQDVLLELNLSGDKTKTGAPESALPALAAKAAALPGVRLRGLMTMGPASASEKDTRAVFRRLKELSASLTLSPQIAPELSMGMSGDFEIAIEEGATLVRIGTAIFGERPPGLTRFLLSHVL